MGTRATYFFEDSDGSKYGVYKHYDNYPSGAADFIENAKEYAWELPRYEADDFAAAFVAANKAKSGGECRLLPMFEHTSVEMVMDEHTFCDYYYEIRFDRDKKELFVKIWETIYFTESEVTEVQWKFVGEMSHDTMRRAYKEAS